MLTLGFYINLEYRIDRNEHTIEELNKIGVKLERFNAIMCASGNIGCTMSHIKCIELAKSRNYPHVFICEDDITFTKPKLLKDHVSKFENSNIEWDVLIIGGNTIPPFEQTTDFCARTYNCQTTTGYVVNARYYDTLIANFREGVGHLLKDSTLKKTHSIDMYWKSLQLIDKWYIITPLSVIQYENYSDIENTITNYSLQMLDLDKVKFFEIVNNAKKLQMQYF
jgi:GR25 family glycosyltransferase involved in LPS biosynthesis